MVEKWFNRFFIGLQIVVGVVLLWSSFEHFKNQHFFLIHVIRYEVFPNSMALLIAFLVPVLELIMGVFLLANYSPAFTRSATSILFVSFGVLHTSALIRGLEIDCGCFGSAVEKLVSPMTATSNFLVGIGMFLSWLVFMKTARNDKTIGKLEEPQGEF